MLGDGHGRFEGRSIVVLEGSCVFFFLGGGGWDGLVVFVVHTLHMLVQVEPNK